MNYPPSVYVPPLGTGAPLRPLNGSPTRARDILEADRALAAIVCGRPLQPSIIGYRWDTSGTYSLRTLVPAYTQQVGFGLLATGQGTVTITTVDDTYDAVATVLVAGATLEQAEWVWMMQPKVVTANGSMRTLNVTDQAVPAVHRFDFDVSGTCTIWAVQLRPLPRSPTAQLIEVPRSEGSVLAG